MRGVYTSPAKIAALNAAKTLMYITAPAAAVVEILSFSVTDESNSTNFQWQVALARITALGTPTATAITPQPHEAGDQAAGSTVKANVTASEPTYAATSLTQEGAPAVGGSYWPPPGADEERHRFYVAPSASAGIRMITTPTSSDVDVRLTHREIG